MAKVAYDGEVVKVVVEMADNSQNNEPAPGVQPKTKDGDSSAKASFNSAIGIGKQLGGFIPGGSEVVGKATAAASTTSSAAGNIAKIAAGGASAGPYVALAMLVIQGLKQMHDMGKKMAQDRRQTEEIQRRAFGKRKE